IRARSASVPETAAWEIRALHSSLALRWDERADSSERMPGDVGGAPRSLSAMKRGACVIEPQRPRRLLPWRSHAAGCGHPATPTQSPHQYRGTRNMQREDQAMPSVTPVAPRKDGMITALFRSRHDAEEAFTFLRQRGYTEQDVNV